MRGTNVDRVLVVVTILRAIKAAAVEDPTTLPQKWDEGMAFDCIMSIGALIPKGLNRIKR